MTDHFVTPRPPEADPSLLKIQRLGVFADWKLPTDEELRFVSEDLRFDDVIFGIARDTSRAGWSPKYSESKVIERIAASRQAGLEPVVMPWAVKSEIGIEEMCSFILNVTGKETASLLDTEEDWYASLGMTKQSAAERVADRLSERTWGVSGIGGLHKTVEPIASLSKFNVPQCYPFWKPTADKHWSHSSSTFPGPQQDQGFERWKDINEQAELIMGLGCYWAERPANGTTPKLSASHTMRFAAIETVSLGVTTAWYWSLKWLMEHGERGDEVRAFFGLVK